MKERLAVIEIFEYFKIRQLSNHIQHGFEREHFVMARLPKLWNLLETCFDMADRATKVTVRNRL